MKSMILFVVAIIGISLCEGYKAEQELLSKLLDKYDSRIIPTNDAGDSLRVDVGFYLTKFVHIDETQGDVDMGFYIGIGWNDSRLSWGSSSKVKQMMIPSTLVWTPDLVVYTGDGAVQESLKSSEKYNVVIQPSGEVYYVTPVNEKVNCIHKSDKYGLSCTLVFGLWTYDKRYITLHTYNGKNEIDTSLLGTYFDQKYKIKNATLVVYDVVYPDVPTMTWSMMKARITLESKKI